MLLTGRLPPTSILCSRNKATTVPVSWSPVCSARERYESLVSYRGSRCEIRQIPYGNEGRSFESIFTRPVDISTPPRRPPLVVMPHGGPHSVSTTSFSVELAFLNAAGFATLQINYRGSTGFGQAPLESLPGSVGSSDIADVRRAVDDVVVTGEINE